MLLNAAQILDARDKKTVTVPVSEWGEGAEVLIGTMSALEYAEFHDWLRNCGRPKAPPPEGADADTVGEEADGSIRVLTCSSPNGQPEVLEEDASAESEESEKRSGQIDDERETREYSFREHFELLVRWALYCILDPETYERAFTLAEVEALGAKNREVLERIADAAMKLHHDTEEAAADFEKNSGGTPDGGSGGA